MLQCYICLSTRKLVKATDTEVKKTVPFDTHCLIIQFKHSLVCPQKIIIVRGAAASGHGWKTQHAGLQELRHRTCSLRGSSPGGRKQPLLHICLVHSCEWQEGFLNRLVVLCKLFYVKIVPFVLAYCLIEEFANSICVIKD